MPYDAIAADTVVLSPVGCAAARRRVPLRPTSYAIEDINVLAYSGAGGARTGTLSEEEARDFLRRFGAVSPLDHWMAEQPWIEVPGGWHVGPARHGWRFEIRGVPEGLQVRGHAPGGGRPAIRLVPHLLASAG